MYAGLDDQQSGLWLTCVDVCKALNKGVDGRRMDQPNQSVLGAIEKLATWVEPAISTLGDSLTKLSIRTVAEIQRHIVERGRRNAISRRLHAKDDKEAITTWNLELNRILRVFKVLSVALMWQLLHACNCF